MNSMPPPTRAAQLHGGGGFRRELAGRPSQVFNACSGVREGRFVIAPVPVRVECRAGYKAGEHPLAVHFADERREVLEILDRWYQGSPDPTCPTAEYFKVRTERGALLLKHDLSAHVWFLMCELSEHLPPQ